MKILLLLALFLISCSSNVADGSGSEVTNGFTIVAITAKGDSISNAKVTLRPDTWIKRTATVTESDSLKNGTTTENGSLTVDGFRSGNYRIHITDPQSSLTAIVDESFSGEHRNLGSITLTTAGSITGSVNQANLADSVTTVVHIRGTDIAVPVTGRNYEIPECPEGIHYVELTASEGSISHNETPLVVVEQEKESSVEEIIFIPKENETVIWKYSAPIYVSSPLEPTIYTTPIRIRLDSTFPFEQVATSGADLHVLNSDSSEVPYYLSYKDANSAVLTLVPQSVSPLTDTFTLFWGNSNAISTALPEQVYNGELGYQAVWSLEESGRSVQKDKSANNNDTDPSTQNSSTYPVQTTGVIGNALTFDGVDDFIVIPNSKSLELGDRFTICFWANLQVSPNNGRIFSKENDFEIKENHGKLQFSSGKAYALSNEPFTENEWFFATITVDRSSGSPDVKIYSNGQPEVLWTNTFLTDYQESEVKEGNPLYLGIFGRSDSNDHPLIGSLDEVRLISRVLAPEEIQLLYESEKPTGGIATIDIQ